MAKTREPEKPVQSESESGEEEDDDDATTEEGSDSEPEQTQVATTPAIVKKIQPMSSAKPPQQQASSSSSDEESGSETDSDSDENARPMDGPQKSNAVSGKARSKGGASVPATPVKSTAAKRPAEEKETEGKDAKKKKPEPENSEKRTLFQRLWSEDDEIVVLKGMIDYAAKKKSDPRVDLSAFHEFIKKNLHVDVTRAQLQNKIKRLKKKYENNKSKEKEGKARDFTNPHELKSYELSKKYWGSENGKESVAEKVVGSPKANGSVATKTPKKKKKKKDSMVDNKEVKDVVADGGENVLVLLSNRLNSRSHSGSAGVEETIMSLGTELFGGDNGGEEGKEWKRLTLEEMEVYRKQLDLRSKQTKLVVDALTRGL